MKLLKMIIPVLMLMALTQACRTTDPHKCKPTIPLVYQLFPNKVWVLRDQAYNTFCRFYEPMLYFDSSSHTCVFSNRIKTVSGTYTIRPCNNVVEVQLQKDTFLLILTAIKPHAMSANEIVMGPDNKLRLSEWNFKEYTGTKRKEDK